VEFTCTPVDHIIWDTKIKGVPRVNYSLNGKKSGKFLVLYRVAARRPTEK